MTMRSDFLGALQNDEPLYNAHQKLDVPPMREVQLGQVVNLPAQLLSARFESEALAIDIARRAAEESAKDAGALPLLSYLLDDMWAQMVKRGDGILRLPMQAIALGGVLVERANAFLASRPEAESTLRQLLTLRLATIRPDGQPMRRRAPRSEFTEAEWRMVSELADHPYRLLVTATLDNGEAYAEVAHEAIFGRWDKLKEWIAAEQEFLAWRGGVEAARRIWQSTPLGSKNNALLMGHALSQARIWRTKRRSDLSVADTGFIDRSIKFNRSRHSIAIVRAIALVVAAVLITIAWTERDYLLTQLAMSTGPRVLTPTQEQALNPKQEFQECAKCPVMVVLPAGEFTMGAPKTEPGWQKEELPQHRVFIASSFAVSKFEVTFEEWDACVKLGGCSGNPGLDAGWGRGQRPVINVSWDDAKQYVTWLSQVTGQQYRLLSESEWEYAARAGANSAYAWGDDIGKNNANCYGCGSKWDNSLTAPVGSFAGNAFGLHDMTGNVIEWVEDCWNNPDKQADLNPPNDGSPWRVGDCKRRVARGGSWSDDPILLRSSSRIEFLSTIRNDLLGFRVARTLRRN